MGSTMIAARLSIFSVIIFFVISILLKGATTQFFKASGGILSFSGTLCGLSTGPAFAKAGLILIWTTSWLPWYPPSIFNILYFRVIYLARPMASMVASVPELQNLIFSAEGNGGTILQPSNIDFRRGNHKQFPNASVHRPLLLSWDVHGHGSGNCSYFENRGTQVHQHQIS